MADRVRAINSVGEDRDRVATCGKGGLVRRAFDPIGTSRDDNPFLCGNGTGEFPGYVLAVGRACPSPGDRDEIAHRTGQKGRRAASPQHVGCDFTKIVEGGGPVSIAWDERSNA